MEEPPFLLDAARVLEYAAIDVGRLPESFTLVVAGAALGRHNVAQVAIAETLLDGALFVLHCNDRWETLGADAARDIAAARASADHAYGSALGAWKPYRALTAEETREIASTTSFLRGIASES